MKPTEGQGDGKDGKDDGKSADGGKAADGKDGKVSDGKTTGAVFAQEVSRSCSRCASSTKCCYCCWGTRPKLRNLGQRGQVNFRQVVPSDLNLDCELFTSNLTLIFYH